MPIDLGTTVATIKAIAGVAKAAGKIDLYNDIISLQQTVLELIADNTAMVGENARLVRENVDLRDKLAALEASRSMRDEMVFKNEAYWRVRVGQPDEGPFCPKCYDGDKKLARMTDRGNGFTCCVVCKHCYGKQKPFGPPVRW